MSVIWHDIECGSYTEDLGLWRALAAQHGGPILDVGAGTGRVALDLARAGHAVTALDVDGELLAELTARAGELDVQTVVADAREFALPTRFALCLAPMQTIQLLGGTNGRAAFLRCVRKHLTAGGVLAAAIAEELELFDTAADEYVTALPDVRELDGVVYSSRPTAVRSDGHGFVLERSREVVLRDGTWSSEHNVIRLDEVDCVALEREGAAAGLRPAGRARIAPTADHVGSTVVMLSA